MKNPAAVELGRRGGLRGGAARAASLSPERRSEIAKIAARTRWGNANRPVPIRRHNTNHFYQLAEACRVASILAKNPDLQAHLLWAQDFFNELATPRGGE